MPVRVKQLLLATLLLAAPGTGWAADQKGGPNMVLEAACTGTNRYEVRVHYAEAGASASAPVRLSGGDTEFIWNPASGQITVYATPSRILWQGQLRRLPAFGRAQQPALELSWPAREDEVLWGLGEWFDRSNLYGRKLDLWIKDAPGQEGGATYFATPVLYSTAGYALVAMDNPESVMDLNSDGRGRHAYARVGSDMTLALLFGDSVKQLISQRADLQGPYRGLPDWAWGPWISRNSYETQAEAEDVLHGMLQRDIPVSAIVQEAWKGPSEGGLFNAFDPDRWPTVTNYLAFCADHDIKNILWQVPILHPSSPHYPIARERGYFVAGPDGEPRLRQHWLAGFANIDFTQPDAVLFWQDLMRPLVRLGVAGFKADDGEDIQAEDYFADGRRGWAMHNEYTARYAKALTDLFDQEGVDGMLWSRSGSLGLEQAPALWAGDQYATWPQMRSLIPAGLSASLSGMPFWGHDIGGYIGNPSADLYLRWVQFGVFSPLMQYHGIEPREPWFFGPEAEQVYKTLAHLRMNLRPTLKALGAEAAHTGLPIMRPMLLEFPKDPRFRNEDTQYMLGPDLLVAPILEPDADGREVLLPEGRWQHLMYPVVFEGPGRIFLPSDYEVPPVLVREGAQLQVECDPGQPLGRWRPGAPEQTRHYPPERAMLHGLQWPRQPDSLMASAPCILHPAHARAASWTALCRGPEGDTVLNGHSEDNRIRFDLPRPARIPPGEIARQQILIYSQPPNGEKQLIFRGPLRWSSPVTLTLATDASRFVREGRRSIVGRLRNRTSRTLKLALSLVTPEANLRVEPPQQTLTLSGGASQDTLWNVAVTPTRHLGSPELSFTVSAQGRLLNRAETWLAYPLRWIVCGPFPTPEKAGFHMPLPPEWIQQPDVRFETATTPVRWWALDPDHEVRHAGINFVEAFGSNEHATAYALTRIHSDREQSVELRFGSDDTLSVWLNGQPLYQAETYRLADFDQDIVPATFRAGVNTVLVKVAQDRGPWGLKLRLTAPGGRPVEGLKDGFDEYAAFDPLRADKDPVHPLPPPATWALAGPFAFEQDAPWPDGCFDDWAAGREAPGPDDWQLATADPVDRIDLKEALSAQEYVDAYARSAFRLETQATVQFEVQSDDGMALWLDGQRLLDVREWRGLETATNHVEAILNPGEHHLVARIRQGKGGWAFRIKARSRPPLPRDTGYSHLELRAF